MSINSRRDLIQRLQDHEYRSLFVSEHIDMGLRFQIRALREARGSQAQVSKEWGKAQPWICKLESPNYGRYSLSTLKEVAEFYDVGLLVQFVPFSTLVDCALRLPDEGLRVPPFSEDVGLIERKPAATAFPYQETAAVANSSGDQVSAPSSRATDFVMTGRPPRSYHNVIRMPSVHTGEGVDFNA